VGHPTPSGGAAGGRARCPFANGKVTLNVVGRTHQKSEDTAALLAQIGGSSKLREMIELFYTRMFADPHLEKFVRDTSDPHAERLADWITEKMGGEGDVWTHKRMSRPDHEITLANSMRFVVHDRSSAHFAAWHSPKRDAADVGEHFKLNDARNWLRLMFWSARDVGLMEHAFFANWYQRFLGHFVRIYESTAVEFVKESARWSESPERIAAYVAAGNRMSDIHNISYKAALKQLKPGDRLANFRNDDPRTRGWPYQ
jgi:truncated hemoglobin YjbI